MTTTAWVLLGIAGAIIFYIIVTYNGLISLKNRVKEAESDIDVQLRRRYELIPNLLASVKGYAKHEKDLFEKISEERAKLLSGGTADKLKANNELANSLKSLFAIAESYPNLRANENFLQLQNELTDTQDKIMAAQRFFNANVRDFNIKIQVFPTNMYAKHLGFSEIKYFEINESEKENVKVEF